MKTPANLNEVQKLVGHIVALNMFISRSTEHSLPFFKALRRTKNFAWDSHISADFSRLKDLLSQVALAHQAGTRRATIPISNCG
ncbi:UNVERIFIED_CONTAM: hypothetical protein Sradi_6661600 [Sesamum radiatum]|uniref:Uncharacterized protein n=1 Tax=Sesamum radiatum TaxID=300843 RepID=A0AAW2JR74_SESRA